MPERKAGDQSIEPQGGGEYWISFSFHLASYWFIMEYPERKYVILIFLQRPASGRAFEGRPF